MEQMNKIVKQVLHTMAVDIDNKWVDKLGFVEFAINSSVNASTSKAPFEMVQGSNVLILADQLDGLHCVDEAQ